MKSQGIAVNYEVIDRCIMNLDQSINDTHVQIELGRLQSIFDYSTGDSAAELQAAAKELWDTYQLIWNIMFETKNMLSVVKEQFQNTDTALANALRGGNHE